MHRWPQVLCARVFLHPRIGHLLIFFQRLCLRWTLIKTKFFCLNLYLIWFIIFNLLWCNTKNKNKKPTQLCVPVYSPGHHWSMNCRDTISPGRITDQMKKLDNCDLYRRQFYLMMSTERSETLIKWEVLIRTNHAIYLFCRRHIQCIMIYF